MPTTPAPERGRHDKEGRQQALIAAGTAVFAELGYDAATTRAVAERAGCSEGLIHRYFGGKHGLLLAILQSRAAELASGLLEMLPVQPTVEAEITSMLRVTSDRMWQDRDVMRVTIARAVIDPIIGQQVGRLFNESRMAFIRQRLELHREAGRISPSADLDTVAGVISGLGFAVGFFGQVVFAMDRDSVYEQAESFARILARGIVPEAQAEA